MHSVLTGPLTVERVTIPIQDLPLTLHGTTLVQLTDFHFDGKSLSVDLLQEAIAQCNAIAPDIVVLTGDYVTDGPGPIHELARFLGTLKSRRGVYAILGNHDSYRKETHRIVRSALETVGITVLWNEIAYPFGPTLPLVGLADKYSDEHQPQAVLAQLPDDVPRIVLAHNPDTAEQLQSLRADLQLSGHTHGGQVYLPGLGTIPEIALQILPSLPTFVLNQIPYYRPDCNAVFKHWEWASGLHTIGQNQLYVNRGLGTYSPGRLFCPPELTLLTLVMP